MIGELLSPRVRSLTLDTARWQYQRGLLSEADWKAYAHAWQTSAPRFEVRVCQCASCLRAYPSPVYVELGTGVATDWGSP